MSSEAILRAIDEQADREVRAILDASRAEAERLVAAARSAADERVADALRSAEPRLQAEAARTVNAARLRRLHARARHVAAQAEVVFATANAELTALARHGATDRARWERAVARLAAEGVAQVDGAAEIIVRREDRGALRGSRGRSAAAATAQPRIRTDPHLPPGVRVRSTDGRVEIDATIPTRLARARVLLAERVASLVNGTAR
jgi:vacuolar-type H+-ATPase subunit E/Vma4